MKSFFGLLLVILSITSFSQKIENMQADAAMRNFSDTPLYGELLTMINSDLNIDGTQYYLDSLLPGKIKLFANDDYNEGVTLRYNIFREQVEVKVNGAYFAAKNHLVSEFIIEDSEEVHKFFNSRPYSGDLQPLGFIRAIYYGEEISLFAKDMKIERKYNSKEAYSSEGNTVRYLDGVQYYLFYKPNLEFVPIKSKKRLLEDFPSLEEFEGLSGRKLKSEEFLADLAAFLEEAK